MPHGPHIYAKSFDMAKAKMCSYSQSDHALPQCKCAEYTCFNLTDQETDKNMRKQHPQLGFTFIT